MKEADVLRSILSYLSALNIFAWRNNTGAFVTDTRFIRYGLKGSSDIIGIYKGKFLAIEVKRSDWKPPKNDTHYEEQKAFIDRVNSEGGIGFFATSVDEVQEALDKIQ